MNKNAPIKQDRLKGTLVLSLIIHALLFALLIWGSWDENKDTQSGGSGTDIDAVMVDPNAIVQQYQRQQSQKQAADLAKQQQAERAEQQAQLLQQQQQQEQQRLKALEQQRLQAQQQAAEQAAALAKQQQEAEQAIKQAQEQQKQAEIAAQKAQEEAKKAAEQAKEKAKQLAEQQAAEQKAKQLAELQAKQAQQQAAAAAKAKAEQAKKQALAEKKQSEEVSDLLGSLSSAKNAPATGSAKPKGPGKQSTSGASSEQINSYAGQIRSAIQSKFYDWQLYRGKECSLRIQLAPDGLLLGIKAEGGDAALCQAAIAAAKQAQLPKPPSAEIYQLFKNAPLDFRPQ